jgi:multicomponent Na+:H+ antiporter subunit B
MNSLILRTATRYLIDLLLLFSIFLLLRGHNEPGGGFVGGLAAAAAFVLYTLAFDVASARQLLRIDPHILIGVGLIIAVASGLVGLLLENAFLTGEWVKWNVLNAFELELGTPLFFDIGVYLVVLGVTLLIVFSLFEE